MIKRLGLLVLTLVLIGAAGYGLWRVVQRTEITDARREGPPAVVVHAGEPRLWVMVKFEELSTFGGSRYHTRYHLELRCHDSRTGARLWSRRLRSISEHDDGHSAPGRILGQDGEVVWLFVGDQPVAVSAADGSVQGTGLDIVAKNPALAKLLVGQLDNHSFDGGLITVAADARRYRVRHPGYLAEPYVPASDEAWRRQQFMATRWNGGYQTRDFLVPAARPAGGWIGLYTEAEAREAGEDGFGDNLKNPWRAWRDDKMARRSLWTARIGRTKAFSEGAHDRLLDPTRLPHATEYLQGGFLLAQGTRQPLMLDGRGLLLLHATRTDQQGRAMLTRLQVDEPGAVRVAWQAELPFTELHNRWQWPDRLLMFGHIETGVPGRSRWQEQLAVVDLATGQVRGWNLTLDQALLKPS